MKTSQELSLDQYLIVKLQEEAAELVQACAKALTFGLDEVYEKRGFSNREYIRREYADVMAVYDELTVNKTLTQPDSIMIHEKKNKMWKWIEYSQQQGILNLTPEPISSEPKTDIPY